MAATLAPHNSHENSDPVFGDTRGPGRGRSHGPRLADLQAVSRQPNTASFVCRRESATDPKSNASPNSGTCTDAGRGDDTKRRRNDRDAGLQADDGVGL